MVTLTCSATSLAPGIYNDTITVTSAAATNSPLTIPVTFTVDGADMIVTAPNGGEFFLAGASTTITWLSSLSGNAKIELLSNGAVVSVIASSTPNNGSYAWTIPTDAVLGSNYRIRVTSLSDLSKFDTSNADFTISEQATFYQQPMNSNPGWTLQGQWAWGVPTGGTTPRPSAGFTGSNVLGYNLAGNYANSLPATYATSTAINCSDYGSVQLAFRRWLGVENGSYDTASVLVSNNGVNWTQVWANPTGTNTQDSTWTLVTYDISAIANGQPTVYLRWSMGPTDGSVNFCGWHIDDVTLTGFRTNFNDTTLTLNLAASTVSEAAGNGATTGTVSRAGTSGDLVASLASDNTSKITVPASVTIPNGQTTSPPFNINAVDNLVIESPSAVTITASASGYLPGTAVINVTDNDNNVPVVNAGPDQTIFLTGNTWSPLELTPQLWLDAADTDTITLNGSTVSQWADKSGFNRHATQGTTGNQPANTPTGLNGKRVLTFDGSNDFFSVNLDFLAGVSHSAFIVTKPVNYSNIYGAATAGAGANSLHVGFSSSTNYRMNFWGNDFGPAITGNFVAGSTNIMDYIWTAGTGKQIMANGKSEGTNTNAGTIGTMSGGGRIGHTTTSSHAAFGGDIAEFIAVTGAVSAADRQKAEGYLAHKWGLATRLAADHPYKTDSPNNSQAIADLDGTVSDADGHTLATTWTIVSGPAGVTLGNASAVDTTATFTVAGIYTLRLTANDGYSQVSDDVVITVNPATSGFTVTYNGNGNTGGSVPVDGTNYNANATVTVLGNTGSLTRTGYTFAGWNTAANGSGTSYPPGSTFNINTQVTLHAQWTANTYTVTFDANGGSNPIPANKSVTFGAAYSTLATTNRAGHTFNGWFTAASGGTQVTTSTTVATASNHTLYAQWTANTYTVSYDGNGNTGGSAPADQTKTHDIDLTLSEAGSLVRSGYVFTGWNTSANGSGTSYAAGATYSANANVILYAHWSLIATLALDIAATSISEDGGYSSVTVTRNIAAASNLTVNLSASPSDKVGIPASVTIPIGETKATFLLAAVNDGLTGTNTVTVSASASGYTGGSDAVDVTDVAADRMKITFNPTSISESGGTSTATLTRINYPNGGLTVNLSSSNTAKATVPATASFSGNSASTTFTVTAVDNALADGDQLVTITASGGTLSSSSSVLTVTDNEGAGYSVMYDANGTTSGTAPSNQTKFPDVNLTLASNSGNLARTGYTFAGWNTSADGTGNDYAAGATYTTNAPLALFAKWTASSYTIIFDANGGDTPSPTSTSVTFGATYGTLAAISRTGYTFNGWFTAASGGSEVTSSTTVTDAANHTLYARWTANSYTVTFNSNGGGAPDLPSKSVTYDSTYGDLATASRTGYTLSGWFTAATGGTQVTTGTTVSITADQMLYAQWTPHTYIVTFDPNGGDTPSPTTKQVVYGSTYGDLATTSRTGYTFNGWFTAASGGTEVSSGTTVSITADQTLYARWTANTYTVTFDSNGGGAPSQPTKSVTFGSTYGTLTTVSRPGYNFDGWFTATSGGSQVTDATPVATASDHTLYAQWSIAPVSVLTSADSVNVPEGGTQTFGVKLSAQPIGDTTVIVSPGSGDSDITVQSGASLTFTTGNWDSYQTVTLAAADDGDAATGETVISCVPSLPSYTGKNVTAVEIEKHATLAVTSDGFGTTSPSGAVIVEKNAATAISATPDQGYDFVKWTNISGSATFGNENTADTTATISASATISANFALKTYTVSYDGNGNTGGTAPAAQQKTHGVDLALAANSGNLYKTEFSFAGWNTAADGTGSNYSAGGTYTGNAALTLYAKWTQGADGTWAQTGAGPYDWSITGNWSGNIVASGTDKTAFFTPNITADQIVNLEAPRTIGNITFTDSTTSSNNLQISGENILTLSRSSGTPVIDVTQSTRTLTISSQISGNNGLQKSGAGILVLSGTANNYIGETVINGGVLQANSAAALGGSTLIRFNGSSEFRTAHSASPTFTQGLAIESGFTAHLNAINQYYHMTVGGAVSGSGTLLIGGTDNGSGNITLTNTGNSHTGNIRIGNTTRAGNLFAASIADGAGAIELGGTTGAGNLTFQNTNAAQLFNTRQVTLTGTTGGGVITNNGATANTVSFTQNLAITGTGNKTLTLGGSNTGLNRFGGNIRNSVTPAAVISLSKTGTGTWALSGTNTYGNTTISAGGGRLIFQGLQALPSNTTLTLTQNSSSTSAVSLLTDNANTTTLNNTLNINHANAVLGINVFVGNNNTSNGGNSSGTTTGSTIAFNKLTFSGLNNGQGLVGIGSVTSNDGYRLQLNNVELPAFNFTSLTNWTARITGNTGAVTLGGTIQQLAGTSGFATNPILSLAGTNANNQVTGAILDPADYPSNTLTRPLAITKIDSGIWTLSGDNSYTGTTTVSAGKLFINGNQSTAAGNVSVSASATLGGTGMIGGNTTIAANGRLEFDLSTSFTTHNKLDLATGKTFIFSGASVLTITSTGGASPGDYTLVTAPGGFGSSVPPATVNLPAGWTANPPRFVGTDLKIQIISTGVDTTPPTLFSITDNKSGGPVPVNTLVTYTVTFSEDMDAGSVIAGDFGNAGTAAVTIGTVNETSPGVFIVQATPTTSGSLQLRINQDAVLKDVAGNNLVTTSAILDDTVITVQTPYESWASNNGLSGASALPGANPDGDSLTNLQEFAFGTNPTVSTSGPISYVPGGDVTSAGLPTAVNLAVGGGVDFRAIFGRRKDYQTAGLTYTVQFSADLTNWVPSTATPTVLTGENSAGEIDAVSVPYPYFIAMPTGGFKKPTFFRVFVTGNLYPMPAAVEKATR